METGEFIPETEAARQLAISAGTLRSWRAKGTGPAYVKMGSSIRYRRADLERWLQSRTVNPEGSQPNE